MAIPFPNGGFESGDATGWTLGPNAAIASGDAYSGTYRLSFTGTGGLTTSVQDEIYPTYAGLVIGASMMYHQGAARSGRNPGTIIIRWFDSNGAAISESAGNTVSDGSGGAWHASNISVATPANATGFSIGVKVLRDSDARSDADSFSWNYDGGPKVVIQFPTHATVYGAEEEIPFRATSEGGWTVVSMSYTVTNTTTSAVTEVGPVTSAPWSTNFGGLAPGHYSVVATATYDNGTTASSAPVLFTVGVPIPPTVREYKASNSYTHLVAENFVGLSGSIPPTAQIVGMQTVVDYYVEALIRSRDIGVTDPTVARYTAAFDMVPSATFEVALLQNNGSNYENLGTSATEQVEILRSDYTVIEDGTSEGKRWTVLRGADKQVTIGNEDNVNGMDTMPAADIVSKSLGLRFYPNLGTKPAYADSGDACFRVHIDRLRVQIYFDAGSVEYYFASPARDRVIKGTLASYNITDGGFGSADASGIFQLTPDLEIVDGYQEWIGNNWTIHAAYPPTDDNQIGDVGMIEGEEDVGMEYNGLPTQFEIKNNRSRYQFVTENFYGDPELNSMYGVHGLPRAFAYNGDYFYKIHTQPDPVKDSPRSVANHHGHLALGFHGGRVDISVVGEPYNFNGIDGASSWAFGDKVVGLLPLSGTILGVFGAKSIWGISGTTVDNFATQVISPNIGAIEYTITDMGFPVYANAYGIYTLSQTQQYGDYLGQPMSKDISPWLRPRLLRKPTSDKEVVCAFPVRSKNQYRLCFSDGYVTSMTLNGEAMPTFSFQKYFLTNVCTPGWEPHGDFETEEAPAYDSGWSTTFEKPSTVRISNVDYWVSPSALYPNGFVIETTEGTIEVENESDNMQATFPASPLEYNNVTAIHYAGAEGSSDYVVEESTQRVEVWRECEGAELGVYDQKSIIPAAVSSELDNHGEERIHIAPYEDFVSSDVPPEPEPDCAEVIITPYSYPETLGGPSGMPEWWSPETAFAIRVPGSFIVWYFYYDSETDRYRSSEDITLPFNGDYEQTLHGEVAAIWDTDPSEYEWSCIHITTLAPS